MGDVVVVEGGDLGEVVVAVEGVVELGGAPDVGGDESSRGECEGAEVTFTMVSVVGQRCPDRPMQLTDG
jgi:hypothetical protein